LVSASCLACPAQHRPGIKGSGLKVWRPPASQTKAAKQSRFIMRSCPPASDPAPFLNPVGFDRWLSPYSTGSLKKSRGVCQQTLSMVALSRPNSFMANMTRGTMK